MSTEARGDDPLIDLSPVVAPVHVDLRKDGRQWAACFAVRLDTIGVCDPRAEHDPGRIRRLLDAQVDFIAALPGIGEGGTIELRYAAHPCVESRHRGRIEVALRVRVKELTSAEARKRAEAVFHGLYPNLVAVPAEYAWVPVLGSAEYQWLFGNDHLAHHAEILRREARLRLSAIELIPRNRSIGFSAEPAEQLFDEADAVRVIAPFVSTLSDLGRLFDILLLQASQVVVSVLLKPTLLRSEELDHLIQQSSHCETFLQGMAPQALPLQQQVGLLRSQLTDTIFSLRDDCYVMTIQVAGAKPLSPSLVETLGTTITGHASATDPTQAHLPRGLMTGGYDWTFAASELDIREARARLEGRLDGVEPGSSGGRLRHLFSAREAGCAFRLPLPRAESFPGLTTRRSVALPLPPTAPQKGLLLGENVHRGTRHEVRMLADDRRRHTYIVGQTGTGKSTLLRSMILQDIEAGRGVAVLDPHGELVDELLPGIPEGRLDDVYYINPERQDLSIGINMLEHRSPLERDEVINNLLEIFYRLYSAIPDSMGPAFEQYFRNACLLEMSHEDIPTLDGVLRIFADEPYRTRLVLRCPDPLIRGFWDLANRVKGDASISGMGQYVTNKLNRFLYNHALRRILLQPRTTIDFQEVLDRRKILLVDLCKGRLGDMNTAFLAMALIGQIQRAAFARTSVRDKSDLPDFYLYIDEFQNVATDSFITILSEARKYRLNAILTNQYMNQIPKGILAAVRGNVGTVVAFRTGTQDAELLQEEFAPSIRRDDLMNLPNFHSYVSTLHRGEATAPFSMRNRPREVERNEDIVQHNRFRIYDRMREYSTNIREVDGMILERWWAPETDL